METNTNKETNVGEVVEAKAFRPYKVTCKVTGEEKKTNPKQFFKTADRIGVSAEVLYNSYVSRKGKAALAGCTAAEAVELFGLDETVAKWMIPTPKVEVAPEVPEVADEPAAEPVV